MSDEKIMKPVASRRGFLAGAGGLAVAAGSGLATVAFTGAAVAADPAPAPVPVSDAAEAFWGVHQGGIATPPQKHIYFAAFDLVTDRRKDVEDLLRSWTEAAARMAAAQTAQPLEQPLALVATGRGANGVTAPYDPYHGPDPGLAAADSGEALGLAAARLTVTFGFGPGLFVKDGRDRYGLAAGRPAALVDMPKFNGDQLVSERSGGDLSVQVCADDPQVAFHAVRQLARLAYGVATLRWTQTGFASGAPGGGTPRNLMGFKDGTQNPAGAELDQVVWVGDEGPDWMRGGSYQAVRRIRIALEHWDRTEVDFQEQVVGRHKYSGAPLGLKDEQEALGLDRLDSDGNPVVPENAHVRLCAAETNGGARILRRGYSYNDGTNMTAERWPPWRQGLEYDAGLLFVAYQRDLKAGFIRIFEGMARFDAMNQFTTHTGGAFFACPGGAAPGGFIGQGLFGA